METRKCTEREFKRAKKKNPQTRKLGIKAEKIILSTPPVNAIGSGLVQLYLLQKKSSRI